jgi:hypothetical protein
VNLYAKFPEQNVINLPVISFGDKVNLMAYRYPVPQGIERKGVVFYIHGYGCFI